MSRLSGRRGETYDFDAAAMIFGGFGAESESTRAAVDATRGLVLQQGGTVVPAYFSADSGGRLATSGEAWGRDLPYFTVRDDPFSAASPHHRWELALTGWQLGDKLRAWNVGQVHGLDITATGPSGRATKMRVRGSRRTVEITGS
jgi:stage II sporulation protein D